MYPLPLAYHPDALPAIGSMHRRAGGRRVQTVGSKLVQGALREQGAPLHDSEQTANAQVAVSLLRGIRFTTLGREQYSTIEQHRHPNVVS